MRGWLVIAASVTVLATGLAVGLVALLRPGEPDEAATDPPWFEDVTAAVGLDFVHDAGDLARCDMRSALGSGAALFDADGDGRLDIYLVNGGGPQSKSTGRFYRQRPDGTFEDATAKSGLGLTGWSTGVAVGDVDNDGRPDVVVTQYGGIRLFLNQGGTFRDATADAGLSNPLWATSATFLDFDRDGRLDLVVVNYVDYDPTWRCHAPSGELDFCAPKTFRGTVTKLFRNVGTRHNIPRFEDVTVSAGLAAKPGPGLGVYGADFDGDGWPDIFVANDGQPNHLWINQKDGTFKEEAFARGIALDSMGQAQAGMGVGVGDVDGDGLFDLFVTHLTSEKNTLWLQGPERGLFRDRTAASGLTSGKWRGTGFGVVLADFDQDGWPDAAVANGRVSRGSTTPNSALGDTLAPYAERNQLFHNRGAGKFRDVSAGSPALCGTPNVARGLACGDIDGDGALDLLVTTVGGPARLLRNVAPRRGHWLLVRAVEPALRRIAYGAEVRVEAGERTLLRVVNPGDSYLCSGDPRAHFGLGDAARYNAIRVRWADGTAERFPGGDADRVIELRKGEGVME